MGTVVIGVIWFGEPATIVRGLFLMGIIECAIGLKFTSGHRGCFGLHQKKRDPEEIK